MNIYVSAHLTEHFTIPDYASTSYSGFCYNLHLSTNGNVTCWDEQVRARIIVTDVTLIQLHG